MVPKDGVLQDLIEDFSNHNHSLRVHTPLLKERPNSKRLSAVLRREPAKDEDSPDLIARVNAKA